MFIAFEIGLTLYYELHQTFSAAILKFIAEAVVHRCPSKTVFLKISKNLQESTSVGVTF